MDSVLLRARYKTQDSSLLLIAYTNFWITIAHAPVEAMRITPTNIRITSLGKNNDTKQKILINSRWLYYLFPFYQEKAWPLLSQDPQYPPWKSCKNTNTDLNYLRLFCTEKNTDSHFGLDKQANMSRITDHTASSVTINVNDSLYTTIIPGCSWPDHHKIASLQPSHH